MHTSSASRNPLTNPRKLSVFGPAGDYEIQIPSAQLRLYSDSSMDYAQHFADLLKFEIEFYYHKKDFRVDVASVTETEFTLDD